MKLRVSYVFPVLLLAGCGLMPSQQTSRLHALPYAEVPAGPPCAASFSIRDLRLAGHLERAEVVSGRQGTQLEISPLDLWAAPLKDELRRSIGRSLEARWPGSRQVHHPWRFGEGPELALELTVDRLEPDQGELQARVRWQWRRLSATAAEPLAHGHFSRSFRLEGSGAQATVTAIARAVDGLSAELAGAASGQGGLSSACRRLAGVGVDRGDGQFDFEQQRGMT